MCRDIANQFNFQVDFERCHATAAILQAQSAQGGDEISKAASAWSTRLKTPPPSTN